MPRHNWALVILFAVLVFGYAISTLSTYALVSQSDAFISVLDVGTADSILITSKNGHRIVIDSGYDETSLNKLSKLLIGTSNKLDLLILTHSHKDHIGGAEAILEHLEVKCVVYINNDKANSETEKRLRAALTKKGASLYDPTNTRNQSEGCVNILKSIPELSIYSYADKFTPTQISKNQNLESLIVSYEHKDYVYWSLADAEVEVQEHLLSDIKLHKQDILNKRSIIKVPHQGAKDAFYQDLIFALKPEIAIISVGDNSYGHPNPDVVDFYRKYVKYTLDTQSFLDVFIHFNGDEVGIKNHCYDNLFMCTIKSD